MIKRNKGKLIVSSIVILLPMLLPLIAGDRLPETVAVHWGWNGEPDGFMDSSLAFFVLPLILLAFHWLCFVCSFLVDKDRGQNKKLADLIFWILPAISLASCGMTFVTALGVQMNVLPLLLGPIFIVIGNYMPKTTRNRTMGIKIRWTLASDENWNATHRFGGKVYVAVGFLLLLSIPLPTAVYPFLMPALLLVAVLLPTIYSYRFYRKQLAKGDKNDETKGDK